MTSIKVRAALLVVCAIVLGSTAATAAALTTTTVVRVPFTLSLKAKAAIKACVGEEVTFTDGEFNVVRHTTITPTGGFHRVVHRNVVGATGTGDTTGTTYRATGHIQSVYNAPPSGGSSFTFELTLNVVGQANAGHFTAHAVVHATVTPAGDLTADVNIFSIHCT